MTPPAIEKIKTILATLAVEAKAIDLNNKQIKAHKLLVDDDIFANTLFNTHSDSIFDYVKEVQSKTNELARLLSSNKVELSRSRLQLIEQQISAILNAINANSSRHNEAQNRLNAIKSRQFKKVAQSMIQPTQTIYQSLAEHHEFERRLMEMLSSRENERLNATANKTQKITEEILAVHQRLGRCRQAISKIERQIELMEKR